MERETKFEESKYSKEYSESSLFDKIIKSAQKAGINVIYTGLLLFYTLQKPLIPGWAKTTIIGALGYFISPLDAIVDVTPVVGYADDLGALVLALTAVAIFIDDGVKKQAKDKLKEWFGDYDENCLNEINSKINK